MGRVDQFEHTQGLVIYNDYMNTLFGDPRIEKELPLIEGAASVGADVFCIDAGWYDSTDGGWWDMVGEWQPPRTVSAKLDSRVWPTPSARMAWAWDCGSS